MEAINCTDLELSTYLRALEEGYSPTCCLDTEQSGPLRSMQIASKCYTSGKKTVFFHGFQSLTMLKPSMEGGLEDSLTSLPAGSHSRARTLVQQEKGKGSLESEADFGRKWQELSVKYDLNTHSWKTHQCLFSEDLELSSLTLPKWGLLHAGVLYQRRMQERPINGTEYGFWPTPIVHGNHNRKGISKNSGDGLATAVKTWPTPCAMEPEKDIDKYLDELKMPRSNRGEGKGPNLATAVKMCEPTHRQMFPAPRAQKVTNENEESWKKRNAAGKVSTPPLSLAVKMFPTPRTRGLLGGTGSIDMLRLKVSLGDISHEDAEKMVGCRIWPTPQSTFLTPPNKDAVKRRMSNGRKSGVPLSEAVAREVIESGVKASDRLNPDWVEILMGWVVGWTSEDPISMEEFEFWAQGGAEQGWIDGSWERDIPRVCAATKEATPRLKAIGNGQVPQCAFIAWHILTEW